MIRNKPFGSPDSRNHPSAPGREAPALLSALVQQVLERRARPRHTGDIPVRCAAHPAGHGVIAAVPRRG